MNIDEYPKYFKYKIYDCFKPVDLQQTRNYLDFLTDQEQQSNNCTVREDDLSQELYSYLTQDIETKLPVYVNQQKLLQFDSNFESGNLDSVYLASQNEYNLLLKVDTNTKGHTYWFYFKVLNWTPKAKATFNILNVVRDLHPFYSRGMNIWTRRESANGRYKSDWDCSSKNNVKVISFKENDIVRSRSNKKEYACGKNYNTLKFTCEFPEITMLKTAVENDVITEVGPADSQGALGNVLCFAYALPYTYSDLNSDLENSKKFLLANGGMIVNELMQQPIASSPKQQKSATKKTKKASQKAEQQLQSPKNANSNSQQPQFQLKDSSVERQVLTKQQIATQELRKQAINVVKEKMGQFEIQLLKADEAQKTPILKQNQQITRGGCKLLEIHTDYLYYKQEIISQSVGGLNIYQITLTKRKGHASNNRPYHKKKCIYITARLHAAETHGSLIMKYIMSELVTRSENYDSILSNYVVKLVPMINTDGVVIGNARSSLVGLDLNRRWADPNASIHPEIYFLKKIMQQQACGQQGISIYCDLHGHNRKTNCFFYGCNKAADEGLLSWTKTRLLPKIFASIEHIFEYNSCQFKQDKHKLNAARVVVWNEMKVTNSFTLETSMYAKTEEVVIKEEQNTAGLQANTSAIAAVNSSITSLGIGEKNKLNYIQLQHSDMHQIAKSFLIATAQYIKLEKELEKEWKLSVGWFKPSSLNAVTGEAKRDKNKREQMQSHRKTIKEQQRAKQELQQPSTTGVTGASVRKKIEKINSSNMADNANTGDNMQQATNAGEKQAVRRKISKITTAANQHGSSTKVTSTTGEGASHNLQSTLTNGNKKEKPKKRQQSLINVVSGQVASVVGLGVSEKGGGVISAAKKGQETSAQKDRKQSLKGPKIQAVVEDAAAAGQAALGAADHQPSSTAMVVTKLKTWKEFFELEEIQKGFAQMKSKKPEKELSEGEGDGSDSEISEDNFDQKELQKNLDAALDLKEGEPNPFEKSIIEEESLKQSYDDNKTLSLQSLLIDDTKEEDKAAVAVNVKDVETTSEQQKSETSETEESKTANAPLKQQQLQIGRQNQPSQAKKNQRKSVIRASSLALQIEKERRRIMGFPDLANQLINQLILQNNARIMQASAAPPSGTAQNLSNNQLQPNNNHSMMNQQDLGHNHVLRGHSYQNKNSTLLSSPFDALNFSSQQNNEQQNSMFINGKSAQRLASKNSRGENNNNNGNGTTSAASSSMQLKIQGQGKKTVQSRQQQQMQQSSHQNNHNSNFVKVGIVSPQPIAVPSIISQHHELSSDFNNNSNCNHHHINNNRYKSESRAKAKRNHARLQIIKSQNPSSQKAGMLLQKGANNRKNSGFRSYQSSIAEKGAGEVINNQAPQDVNHLHHHGQGVGLHGSIGGGTNSSVSQHSGSTRRHQTTNHNHLQNHMGIIASTTTNNNPNSSSQSTAAINNMMNETFNSSTNASNHQLQQQQNHSRQNHHGSNKFSNNIQAAAMGVSNSSERFYSSSQNNNTNNNQGAPIVCGALLLTNNPINNTNTGCLKSPERSHKKPVQLVGSAKLIYDKVMMRQQKVQASSLGASPIQQQNSQQPNEMRRPSINNGRYSQFQSTGGDENSNNISDYFKVKQSKLHNNGISITGDCYKNQSHQAAANQANQQAHQYRRSDFKSNLQVTSTPGQTNLMMMNSPQGFEMLREHQQQTTIKVHQKQQDQMQLRNSDLSRYVADLPAAANGIGANGFPADESNGGMKQQQYQQTQNSNNFSQVQQTTTTQLQRRRNSSIASQQKQQQHSRQLQQRELKIRKSRNNDRIAATRVINSVVQHEGNNSFDSSAMVAANANRNNNNLDNLSSQSFSRKMMMVQASSSLPPYHRLQSASAESDHHNNLSTTANNNPQQTTNDNILPVQNTFPTSVIMVKQQQQQQKQKKHSRSLKKRGGLGAAAAGGVRGSTVSADGSSGSQMLKPIQSLHQRGEEFQQQF